MSYQAVDFIIKHPKLLEYFDIPNEMHEWVIDSWQKKQADFLARYDFLIEQDGKIKLIEINADTPTMLIESGYA